MRNRQSMPLMTRRSSTRGTPRGLAIEIDGEHHYYEEQQEKDAIRDRWLAAQGIQTLRIPGFEIMADPEEMAKQIRATALERVRSV